MSILTIFRVISFAFVVVLYPCLLLYIKEITNQIYLSPLLICCVILYFLCYLNFSSVLVTRSHQARVDLTDLSHIASIRGYEICQVFNIYLLNCIDLSKSNQIRRIKFKIIINFIDYLKVNIQKKGILKFLRLDF